MGIESLNELDLINGIFTFLFVLISIIIGFRILLKYFKLKRIELLTIGFAWIFVSSGWWGSSTTFLSILITGEKISVFLFLFLSNAFIPIAIVCWTFSLAHIFYKNSEMKILLFILLICIPYEIILLTLLFIDISLIGTVTQNFNSQPTLIALGFQIFALIYSLLTGCLFSFKSIAQDDPEIKWKGRFLLIGFISFTIGSLFDAIFDQDPITLVLIRLLLISSAIEYYFGFFLPKIMKDLLIK